MGEGLLEKGHLIGLIRYERVLLTSDAFCSKRESTSFMTNSQRTHSTELSLFCGVAAKYE